jgi:uncharacterized protein
MSEKHLLEIKSHTFSAELIDEIKDNNFVKGCWPLVYILSDDNLRQAYVGETTDALSRLSTHLKNSQKNVLTTARLIMSDKFNKSAALDIESNLIKYLAGDGKFKLLNANLGIANHSYYQKKEIYWDIFLTLWEELKSEGVVSSSIESINNSDLFKYSPYKALTSEQKTGLVALIKTLLDENASTVLVEGGAGTGKTILAIYLFAILYTDIEDFDLNEFSEEEQDFHSLVLRLKNKYPNPKAAIVIPMSGFRETISKVFKNVKNLKASMVIGPAQVSKETFDILIVDESHRLRKRVNLGAYFGAFDKVNIKLGLNKETGDELDWVLKQSKKNLFFYDAGQSIKPSDVDSIKFQVLKQNKKTTLVRLQSQLRSRGGNDYVAYISGLLTNKLTKSDKSFISNDYELLLFDSLDEMISEIKSKDSKFGLARLVAGFSWKWVSNTEETKHIHDITIGTVKLRWNGTNSDWVNSTNALNEVGCIHTTQGYDLNYTGVIFGKEISFDKHANEIVIKDEHYFDKNGKQNVRNPEELREFIVNIYKTLLLRAVKGTYIFVCDPDLREYFEQHIAVRKTAKKISKFRDLNEQKIVQSPYLENFIDLPLYDSVGCGDAMIADETVQELYPVPSNLVSKGAKYFVLRTAGDSMNQIGINDGDLILCQKNYQAPSGSIAVVLIDGNEAVLKEIRKEKDGLLLRPKSTNPRHKERRLGEYDEFMILGTFVKKLN